jgi:hypothetical protein
LHAKPLPAGHKVVAVTKQNLSHVIAQLASSHPQIFCFIQSKNEFNYAGESFMALTRPKDRRRHAANVATTSKAQNDFQLVTLFSPA